MASNLAFSADHAFLNRIDDRNAVTSLSLTSSNGVDIALDAGGDVDIQTAGAAPTGNSVDLDLTGTHWHISFDANKGFVYLVGDIENTLGIKIERHVLNLNDDAFNLKKETGKFVLTVV